MEKTFELGTQFPHDIMTGDFTSRASSETTETIMQKRVRGFQRYLCSKLKRELFEPILEQNGINTEEAKLEISFTTQNIIALEVDQVSKLFADKVITLREVRDWFASNTGMELDEKEMKDLLAKADFQQDAKDMMNQNKFGKQVDDLEHKIEMIKQDSKLSKQSHELEEKLERKIELVKDAIKEDKDDLARRRIRALEKIIEKVDEIG